MNAINENGLPDKPIVKRFPGVASFEDDNLANELFFGREEEICKLLHYILAENLVVIFSYSGYGKTSLLQAGVFQKLREKNFYPLLIRFNKKELSPTDVVKTELIAIKEEKDYDIVQQTTDDASIKEFIENLEIWSPNDKLLTPVIVFDQFEEIFTLEHNLKHRKNFFEDLADLLKGSRQGEVSVKIVISIREDFLGHLEKMAINIPSIFTNRFRLEALKKENAASAIIEPARKVVDKVHFTSPPFIFSPQAKEELLNFLSSKMSDGSLIETNEVEPVQLQIICSEIEDRVIKGKIKHYHNNIVTIGADDLGGHKGMADILSHFYERQIEKVKHKLNLSYKEINRVKEIVETHLIAGIRRVPFAYESLINIRGCNKKAIDLLIDYKVLRLESHHGNTLLELSHDRLVEPVLESLKKRKEEAARAKQLKIVSTILLSALVAAGIMFYFDALKTERTKALQANYYYVAMEQRRNNPTLAYKIALDGSNIDPGSNNPIAINLKNLLAEFNNARSTNYAYIVNRFKAPSEIVSAVVAKNRIIITDKGGIYFWSLGGDLEKSHLYSGKVVIGSSKVRDTVFTVTNNFHNTAELWDENNTMKARFSVDSNAFNSAQSTNGKYLIIGNSFYSRDNSKRLFDFVNWGNLRGTMPVIFSSDGKLIISGHWPSQIYIQDTSITSRKKANKIFRHGPTNTVVTGVAITNDSKKIVSVSRDKTARIFHLASNLDNRNPLGETNTIPLTLEGHTGDVNCVSISPDQKYILTGGSDEVAILWNFKGEKLAYLKGHSYKITFVGFSDNSEQMVTGDEGGNVYVWQRKSPEQLERGTRMAKFSPFEYSSLGLYSTKYKLDNIYNLSLQATIKDSIRAVVQYTFTLPKSNSYPGDSTYFKSLDTSIQEIESLYQKIFQSSAFNTVSAPQKRLLYITYSDFILKKPQLLLEASNERDSSSYTKYEAISIFYRSKNVLMDMLDTVEASRVARAYHYLSDRFFETNNYKQAIEYAAEGKKLAERFTNRYPQNRDFKELIYVFNKHLGLYHLYNNEPSKAIEFVREALKFQPKNVYVEGDSIIANLSSGNYDLAKSSFMKLP